ncbi:hypothetical protein CP979_29325 [Streptomyces filamentosus]|nr:hypothetical protein CP979_29325 [Streptomyces filamentosus]
MRHRPLVSSVGFSGALGRAAEDAVRSTPTRAVARGLLGRHRHDLRSRLVRAGFGPLRSDRWEPRPGGRQAAPGCLGVGRPPAAWASDPSRRPSGSGTVSGRSAAGPPRRGRGPAPLRGGPGRAHGPLRQHH